MHLACYLSFNRAQFGAKRKELWRCPFCRVLAYFNVYQGNFHLSTKDPQSQEPNDTFVQCLSHEKPQNIRLFRR